MSVVKETRRTRRPARHFRIRNKNVVNFHLFGFAFGIGYRGETPLGEVKTARTESNELSLKK